jgi:hypothetical protein
MANLWTIPSGIKKISTVIKINLDTTQKYILINCLQLQDKNKTA